MKQRYAAEVEAEKAELAQQAPYSCTGGGAVAAGGRGKAFLHSVNFLTNVLNFTIVRR